VSEVRANITRLVKSKSRYEETLENLRKLNLSKELHQQKQEELENNVKRLENQILEEREKERCYTTGELDRKINEELSKNSKAHAERRSEIKKKKVEIQKEDDSKKEKMSNKKYKNDDRNIAKDHNYYYRLFQKAQETLPQYIRSNLAEMPGNKGYIWRDCWFFGDNEAERGQPTIMFEKRKGGILYIHEIDNYEHRIFEKNGKEKKRLISTRKKKYKPNSSGIRGGTNKRLN
jgi:hypothetical protein